MASQIYGGAAGLVLAFAFAFTPDMMAMTPWSGIALGFGFSVLGAMIGKAADR